MSSRFITHSISLPSTMASHVASAEIAHGCFGRIVDDVLLTDDVCIRVQFHDDDLPPLAVISNTERNAINRLTAILATYLGIVTFDLPELEVTL